MHSVLQIWMKVCTKILEVLKLIKTPYDLEQDTQVVHNMFAIISDNARNKLKLKFDITIINLLL